MTERTHALRRTSRIERSPSFSRTSFCLICLFFLALLIRNSRIAVGYVTEGLSLCAKTLIPSLFPFMVVSELLISSGITRPIGRLLNRPFHRLFGVGGEGAGAMLLGFICGFPLGAKTAVSLYRRGRIRLADLSRLMTFCNVPSLGFLVFAVGDSLLHSRRLGIELYVVTLVSALLIGIGSKYCLRRKEAEVSSLPPQASASISTMTALTDAVSSSATAMLRICGFVLFFSALVGILEQILSPLSLSEELSALLFGAFELTGGMSRAALCPPAAIPYLCAALAGWSGLSVHFQIISLCEDTHFSTRVYFLAKGSHGLLNVLLLWGYNHIKLLIP